jgi:hypothetical protein
MDEPSGDELECSAGLKSCVAAGMGILGSPPHENNVTRNANVPVATQRTGTDCCDL